MSLLHNLINLYIFILGITAVLSWFPANDPASTLGQVKRALASLTEPLLRPIRSMMPRANAGGITIDFSIWIAIILLEVINSVI